MEPKDDSIQVELGKKIENKNICGKKLVFFNKRFYESLRKSQRKSLRFLYRKSKIFTQKINSFTEKI